MNNKKLYIIILLLLLIIIFLLYQEQHPNIKLYYNEFNEQYIVKVNNKCFIFDYEIDVICNYEDIQENNLQNIVKLTEEQQKEYNIIINK